MLPEWLESKNDFNEAKRLIGDIGVDMNKFKASKEDKKVFNDLNKLIIDINNDKVKDEDTVERFTNIYLTWINQSKNKVLFFEIKWFKLFTSYLIHLVLIKSLHHCLAK